MDPTLTQTRNEFHEGSARKGHEVDICNLHVLHTFNDLASISKMLSAHQLAQASAIQLGID